MTAEPDVIPADVSIKDLEERWGKISRNGLKARAKALGVELRRVSSTLTVWPGEFVDLGQQLHDHIKAGNPIGTFPGLPAAVTASTLPSLPPPPPANPLARARALAAAADEALPLESAELAAVLGVSVEAIEQLPSGAVLRGFRLRRAGRGLGRYWRVERCWRDGTAPALTAGSAGTDGTVPALTAGRRPVGFGADVIEARCQLIGSGPVLPLLPGR